MIVGKIGKIQKIMNPGHCKSYHLSLSDLIKHILNCLMMDLMILNQKILNIYLFIMLKMMLLDMAVLRNQASSNIAMASLKKVQGGEKVVLSVKKLYFFVKSLSIAKQTCSIPSIFSKKIKLYCIEKFAKVKIALNFLKIFLTEL